MHKIVNSFTVPIYFTTGIIPLAKSTLYSRQSYTLDEVFLCHNKESYGRNNCNRRSSHKILPLNVIHSLKMSQSYPTKALVSAKKVFYISFRAIQDSIYLIAPSMTLSENYAKPFIFLFLSKLYLG